ncbi:transposase [Chromohalobacter salexigens]|nr:transposase [Chromohalobacter salexigens]
MIDRWIRYYNEERPHQSLGYVAPSTSRITGVGCAETRGSLQHGRLVAIRQGNHPPWPCSWWVSALWQCKAET